MPNPSTPSIGGQAAALNLNEQLALISEAQKGISRGWSFTPCHGKDAFRRGWQSEADLPLDQLRRYVSDGCNLGLRCGHGIAVVDIDPAHGGNADRLALPETVVAETGGGGRHYYFQYDEDDLRNDNRGCIAPGVDFKTTGGYVIFPGSRHPVTGRLYTWMPSHSPDDLSLAPLPADIAAQVRRPPTRYVQRAVPIDCGGPIREGQRRAELLRIAGGMRNHGCGEESILGTLRTENAARCEPPLEDDELRDLAADVVGRYSPGAPAADSSGEAGEVEHRREHGWSSGLASAGDTLDSPADVDWLINDMIAANETLIIGAPLKTMKSSILLDLCCSLATGRYFLDEYPAATWRRVALFVGETARHIMRLRLRGYLKYRPRLEGSIRGSLHIAYKTPKFYQRDCVREVERILQDRFEVLAIDPYYMSVDGTNSANLMLMGEQLSAIADMCRDYHATLIFAHHTKKSTAKATDDSIDLSDLCGAGVAEFARQWMILSRNGEYDFTGVHHLFVTMGGAYRHTRFGLDIEEGDINCPKWIPTISPIAAARSAARVRRADVTANQRVQAILNIITDEPVTSTAIARRLNMSNAVAQSALQSAVSDGTVRIIPVMIHGREFSGYCRATT
jgi:hypothetical protein